LAPAPRLRVVVFALTPPSTVEVLDNSAPTARAAAEVVREDTAVRTVIEALRMLELPTSTGSNVELAALERADIFRIIPPSHTSFPYGGMGTQQCERPWRDGRFAIAPSC
jgi:hypothetical protein